MASPQTKNGFMRIALEIQDALVRIRIPGNARQVLDFVLRKTYGYQKIEDRIALSQFVTATGLEKPEVCRGLRKLFDMNLIKLRNHPKGNIYSFNKDFDTWKLSEPLAKMPKAKSLAKMPTTIGKNANESLAKMPHTIDNYTKDTMTIDKHKSGKEKKALTVTDSMRSDAYDVIDAFKGVNTHWHILHESQKQYDSAFRMLAQHGREIMIKVIRQLSKTNEAEFFPRIYTPAQLEEKWDSLKNAWRKTQRAKTKIL